MRRRAFAAAIAAVCAGACGSRDAPPVGADPLDMGVENAAPRPRPAELAHLTLKVVGMT